MHMSDALLSAQVGAVFWVVAGGAVTLAARRVRATSASATPMAGVMGAFVFAAQMVNFTIPGTGSSGHLAGGMLLAILLGPYPALLAMTSVLTIQALFFADGGLLALGANILNMGVIPCLVLHPMVFRPLAGAQPVAGRRLRIAVFVSAWLALLVGALGVVVETWLSGISGLPFTPFLLTMGTIHLAIGLVEGAITVAVVALLLKARPDWPLSREALVPAPHHWGRVPVVVGVAALLTGGVLSWFASASPDGLEWSVSRLTGTGESLEGNSTLHQATARLQAFIAPMPDYAFRSASDAPEESVEKRWGAPDGASSLAGIAGGVLTVLILGLLAGIPQRRKTTNDPPSV
ncbi:MAG: energy-coupling factor ABC transporter permease [Magnetococcales bacterium]|nr:energy-coupling factor ABC transporter permease [Magnetococcales bacterium]MBF0260342.1 energy-coupling factor ABC transporter permease [Magnetococcales bacterium]